MSWCFYRKCAIDDDQLAWIYFGNGNFTQTWVAPRIFYKGAFNNHVDKIFPILHNPPTPSGQTWTFGLPPTHCPHGQLKNDHPLLNL